MIPRGEVGIVVAGIALGTGVMSDDIYAAVIGMVLVTTIAGPFLIKLGYGSEAGDRGSSRDRRARRREVDQSADAGSGPVVDAEADPLERPSSG
jgi:hypothetical protein